MKIQRSILACAALVLALGACGSDAASDTTVASPTTVAASRSSTPPVDSSAPATTPAGSTPAAGTPAGRAPVGSTGAGSETPVKDVKVSIGDFKFEPATVTVAVGGTPVPVTATDPDTPVLHDEIGSNESWSGVYDWGDVDGAFAEADHVVKISELHFDRFNSTPLELDGALAAALA